MGFYTWATHGNQRKPGNWETWQPMSCFPETLKKTSYGNLRNLPKLANYISKLTIFLL